MEMTDKEFLKSEIAFCKRKIELLEEDKQKTKKRQEMLEQILEKLEEA